MAFPPAMSCNLLQNEYAKTLDRSQMERASKCLEALYLLARLPRLERGTLGLEGRCSIHLSYRRPEPNGNVAG